MANAPITRPRLHQNRGGAIPGLTRAVVGDGSNTFATQQFVSVASGVLVAYAADDTVIYGLSPDKSHAATDEPYSIPYGENHNVIDPRGALFVMNFTDGSGTVGSGSTRQADATVGSLYSARYLGTVDTSALAVDISDTGTATKNIFRYEGPWPEDASTDFNGRGIFSVLDTAIQ